MNANRPLRVACVISSLRLGGSERVLAWLAETLAARGHDVRLFTATSATEEVFRRPEGVVLRNLDVARPSRGPWQALRLNLRHLAVLREAVCSVRPDVVLAFGDRTNVRVLLALAGTEIPVIVSERTNPRLFPTGRIWSLLRRLAYPRAAVVAAPNARCLDALGFLPKSRRRVVPNPVLVSPAAEAMTEGRRPVIVGLGRLVELKGFDRLIRAFADMAEEFPDWSLEIHGEGPERPALEALARALGVVNRVRLPGVAREPRSVFETAAIFALSSRLEGSPNALAEAMACGVAAVAFDCEAGPRELIRDGEDGLLVPAGDVKALSRALRDLAGDPERRERLGLRARDVARRHDPAIVAAQWETLLEEVAAGGRDVRATSPGDPS